MNLIRRVLLASFAPLAVAVAVAGCGLIGYGDSGAPPPSACFPSIAIGDDHTCVVNRSGHVFCWGADDHGQTSGTPGGGLRAAPVQVTLPGAVSASAVAAGPGTSCALGERDVLYCWGARPGVNPPVDFTGTQRVAFPADAPAYRIGLGQEFACAKVGSDDHVVCWGAGAFQRLGQDDSLVHPDPIAVTGPIALAALAVGQRAACALQGDGTVWCWGDNRRGQLGLGVTEVSRRPTVVAALAGTEAMALGDDVACALAGGGLRCWGGNDLGQLGSGAVGADRRAVGVDPLATGVQAIATMASGACALLDDGTVHCWGQNRSGELGQGDLEVRPGPVMVPNLTGVRSIAAGYHAACAEKDDVLWCWGSNLTGQLGRGNAALDPMPRPIGAGTVFRNVRGGGGTLCAVDAQTVLWCWGDGEQGQAGLGAQRGAVAPVAIMTGVREVAVGNLHACARGDTTVWCWGANGAGQLGKPTLIPGALTPQVIIGGFATSAIAVGSNHSCAIVAGVLKCWGDDAFGQLGDGGNAPRSTPFVVPLTGAVRLAAGAAHTCVIDDQTRMWCWGAGTSGQLGDTMGTSSSTPIQVFHPNAKAWVSLAAGRAHTCGIDEHAVIWCWGDNSAGQLGSPGANAMSPRVVVWPDSAGHARELFIRQDSTCATLDDGTSKCWGADGFGALGAGGATPRSFGTFTDAVSYGGGLYDLCAVRSNGELWCAGAGDRGQLGADLVGWTPANVPVPCD